MRADDQGDPRDAGVGDVQDRVEGEEAAQPGHHLGSHDEAVAAPEAARRGVRPRIPGVSREVCGVTLGRDPAQPADPEEEHEDRGDREAAQRDADACGQGAGVGHYEDESEEGSDEPGGLM